MTDSHAFVLPSSTHVQGLANYPHARIVPGPGNGISIYVSGISSRRADGTFVGASKDSNGNAVLEIGPQTAEVLTNIETVIKGASNGRAGLESIVDATVFLTDIPRDYAGMNVEWNKIWPNRMNAPARTTVEVRALPNPNILVEIKCTVYVPPTTN
ncbi:putative L-PSP endoribonuclease family protein [Xylogone sp. PMI_703]|nr:putative L-PSP endoribonuclease family protein [Xylogone sp. PMI_703]